MPKSALPDLAVTWEQVAAFRLKRHHLLERASKKDLATTVRAMGGAQAQLLSAAQISLWSRVKELEIQDIEAAMHKRSLVKAACMRRTLFLVPGKDLAVFVRGTARRAEKEIRWAQGKGVPLQEIETAIQAALGVMDEPLTRPEIAERTCRSLGVQIGSYHGGGWGNRRDLMAVPVGHLNYPVVDLLHLAAARGVVCYGPARGNESTFVRADAWIPKWKDVSQEEAEATLLHWYLRSFGPATAADFALWSGITLTDARQTWAQVQQELAPVDVEGWPAFVLKRDIEELMESSFSEPSVRLLPYFDSYLLGHKEREHLAAAEHRPRIYRPQGWIAPVLLVNGRALGVWESARAADRLQLKLTPFGSLSRSTVAAVRDEAEDLARFLSAEKAEVQISK